MPSDYFKRKQKGQIRKKYNLKKFFKKTCQKIKKIKCQGRKKKTPPKKKISLIFNLDSGYS